MNDLIDWNSSANLGFTEGTNSGIRMSLFRQFFFQPLIYQWFAILMRWKPQICQPVFQPVQYGPPLPRVFLKLKPDFLCQDFILRGSTQLAFGFKSGAF